MKWLWQRKPTTSQAASLMAKHGAEMRRLTERERVIAKAREMRRQMGMPIPPVLAEGGR